MTTTVVVGLQWGDEGKGKIIDFLSSNYLWTARFGGGPNAGHTVYCNHKKVVFHHIPCASINRDTNAIIAQGVVIDIDVLIKELSVLENMGIDIKSKLFISDRSHIIMPYHKIEDKSDYSKVIGTTAQGVGPAYGDKISRIGLRLCDFVNNDFERFKQFFQYKHIIVDDNTIVNAWNSIMANISKINSNIVDTSVLLRKIISRGQPLLIESAHGTMLDIDFGTYPYVTSSYTTLCGVNSGLGVTLKNIDNVIGIMKAYTTRVGEGFFVSEDKGEIGKWLQSKGNEFGSTTGRPRRCGWLDLVALRYALSINDVSYIAITKLDVLSGLKEIPVLVSYKLDGKILENFPSSTSVLTKVEGVYEFLPGWNYFDVSNVHKMEDLPVNLIKYVEFIEDKVQCPIRIISFGVNKQDVITR